MAVQRADDDYDRPRRWWDRAGLPVGSPDLSQAANDAVSQAVSQAASHAVDQAVSQASWPAGSPATSSARSPARSPATKPVRIGDTIVHPDIDGLPVPAADEYARVFVGFVQEHPALQEHLGGWISTGALKRRYYPQFGATIGKWPLLPWRTVATELGLILEKRDRQTRQLIRRGKRRRLTVSEYRIPEAQGGDQH